MNENLKTLELMIHSVNQLVLSHRYNDPVPEIRALCLEKLGLAILNYPGFMIEDKYLKYFVVGLTDINANVRICSLKFIENLLKKKEFKHSFFLFLDKCKRHLLNYINAPEEQVRVLSITILTMLDFSYEGQFDADEASLIYAAILSNSFAVAEVAGLFMIRRMFPDEDDQMDDMIKSLSISDSSEKQVKRNKPQTIVDEDMGYHNSVRYLMNLATYIVQNDIVDDVAYLVDALWKNALFLKDWGAYYKILIEHGEELTIEEQPVIAKLMVFCVEKAIEGDKNTPRREKPKKQKGVNETQRNVAIRLFTEKIANVFPQLLSRYMGDRLMLEQLVKLPKYFDLNLLVLNRSENSFKEILLGISEIFLRHVEVNILDAISFSLSHFLTSSSKLSQMSMHSLTKLSDHVSMVTSKILKALKEKNWMITDETIEHFDCLGFCFRRLAALHRYNDLMKFNHVVPAIFILQRAANGLLPRNAESAIASACELVLFDCVFACRSFLQKEEENMLTFVKERQKSINPMISIIERNAHHKALPKVFNCLLDLFLLFSPGIPDECPLLEKVIFRADDHMQMLLFQHLDGLLRKYTQFDDSESVSQESSVEGEKRNFEKWQAKQDLRKQLVMYHRLIISGQLSISNGVIAVRHFVNGQHDFGDIFKEILRCCRQKNQTDCGQMIHDGLVHVFLEGGRQLPGGQFFVDAPEMAIARKTAQMISQHFGLDTRKVRDCIKTIHFAGVSFALSSKEPMNDVAYFDVLRYFVPKLLVADRQQVKEEFEKLVKKRKHQLAKCSEAEMFVLKQYAKQIGCDEDEMPPPSKASLSQSWKRNLESIDEVSATDAYLVSPASDLKIRRGAQMKSIEFGSDWSSPISHSTAIRKGRKIVFSEDNLIDEQQQEPIEFQDTLSDIWKTKVDNAVDSPSPAKRKRKPNSLSNSSIRSQSRNQRRTWATTVARDDDSMEGFTPLAPAINRSGFRVSKRNNEVDHAMVVLSGLDIADDEESQFTEDIEEFSSSENENAQEQESDAEIGEFSSEEDSDD